MRRGVWRTAVGGGLVFLGGVGAVAPALANPDSRRNGPPPALAVDGGAVPYSSIEEPFLGVIIPHDPPPFTLKGRSFNYFDGMLAQAEARVREERILVTLIPGLKGALGHED